MKAALTILFVLFLYGPAAAQDLPPDILADQYLLEATKALENGNPQGALQAFGKIEALDTEPPLEFAYFYGKLLVENGTALDDLLKGQSLLKSYVISIEKDSEHYTPTLELLSAVGSKLEKAEAARRAEQRRQEQLAKLKDQLPQFLADLMVSVQGGTFTMGGCMLLEQGEHCPDDQKPAHQVRVSSFEISKYKVTQELWEAVMGQNPSRFKSCPQCPVDVVSWNDVQAFLRKVNAQTGEKYRLLTEAEWEYAARGGQHSQGYRYAGSNNPSAVAWYSENSDDKGHPVGQKQANELGLYDMSGNGLEWVEDCWHESYAGAPSDGRAWEGGNCGQRVLRSNSMISYRPSLSSRSRNKPGRVGYDYGFRIARSLS